MRNTDFYVLLQCGFRTAADRINTGTMSMANKKSLNEQIADVMNMSASNNVKRVELLKLGIDATEVYLLLNTKAWQGSGFDFNALTFGCEIECFSVIRNDLINNCTRKGLSVRSEYYNHDDHTDQIWKVVSDGSLTGENSQEVCHLC